jgi:hypothetical protein
MLYYIYAFKSWNRRRRGWMKKIIYCKKIIITVYEICLKTGKKKRQLL